MPKGLRNTYRFSNELQRLQAQLQLEEQIIVLDASTPDPEFHSDLIKSGDIGTTRIKVKKLKVWIL